MNGYSRYEKLMAEWASNTLNPIYLAQQAGQNLKPLDGFFEEVFKGFAGRVIQHEYDHIEGKLFTDYLSPLRKRFLKKRLNDIAHGNVQPHYKIKVPIK